MKKFYLSIILILSASQFVSAQSKDVKLNYTEDGISLQVDGQDVMINGMNWDYFPVGTNYSYSLWKQTDELIIAALESEMSLLKGMGVNVIRQYSGVPPRWVKYIYENYGIYTMLNHSFGRYGLSLNGTWEANTEYSDARVKKLLLSEVKTLSEEYKDTPGLLLYLLGNENNYGLFWGGAETEDIPLDKRKSTVRARAMYKLFNQAAVAMKEIDDSHPVALCNGDLLFLDIIAEECEEVDIFGTNMYRGSSFRDAFQKVKDDLNKPILFTEFGSDAYSATQRAEDQKSQAHYLVENWKEIYENTSGKGKTGNSIGGFTFQFSDGWWKYGQTSNLDVHDNNASWSNEAYQSDWEKGENNMNEEWFGICAKGLTDETGLYQLYPRAAYYALKEVHELDPTLENVTLPVIDDHFAGIQLGQAVLSARSDKAALESNTGSKVRISGLRAELTTFNTGGTNITTPNDPDPTANNYPDQLGFDHMQSFYVDVEARPTDNIRAEVSFNILGNVAQNPINEIFYENRGRPIEVQSTNGTDNTISSNERLKVYSAQISWNDKWFDLTGFYRTGHYHWGYEGDFFGLYPEANYGPNLDTYNGLAPLGVEINAKKALKGLKIAFGPQLWWGANPAILAKYNRKFGKIDLTGVFHEDIDEQGQTVSSIAIPQQKNRRATLYAKTHVDKLGIELGGIWSGQPRVGDVFQLMKDSDPSTVYQDEILHSDTWGGKAKLTYSNGPINWYAQGAAMGLVAQGGTDYTQTYTGWRLKDSGSGNQYNFLTGFTYSNGFFQVAPNFLWQQPLVDPMPLDVNAPGRARNIINDPFAVRSNRETVAGEILFTYDPTPETWMYQWDNDKAEDAKFAANLGFVYRHLPTTQDAAIGILADGRSVFAFASGGPAEDLWEVHSRLVSKLNKDFGWIANLYGGNGQANGDDDRIINRFGADLNMIYKKAKFTSAVKVNDWGPFDYHRDFNLTFPLQLTADISTTAVNPLWFDTPTTKLGASFTWRVLDQYSPRYCPDKVVNAATGDVECLTVDDTFQQDDYDFGNEWEIRTYIHININN